MEQQKDARLQDRVTLLETIVSNMESCGRDLRVNLIYATIYKLVGTHREVWNLVPRDKHIEVEAFERFEDLVDRILARYW